MKKEYSKVLRDGFLKRLPQMASGFKPFNGNSKYLFSGEKACYRELNPKLWQFVILSPNATGLESFTLELGWSRLARFPELGMRPSYFPDDCIDYGVDELITRLPLLYGGSEFWLIEDYLDSPGYAQGNNLTQSEKISQAVAQERAFPLLNVALDMFEQYGLPFLDKADI